ncbi:hypothetical protein FACS1894200_08500 [Spirochaetia bacterium]|nr:hypothetical protein FACS1894200_08500 [Spirochaetia bacterium]
MDSQIESSLQHNILTFIVPPAIIEKCLAVRLYQSSLVSIGKAAELAGMDRIAFEYFLSNNRIPISNLSLDTILADAQKIKDMQAVS